MTRPIHYVGNMEFPFDAVLTNVIADPDGDHQVEVGEKVKVVGYHDEPHSYVVKHGRHEYRGVSPLFLEHEDRDDPLEPDPTADPIREMQLAGLAAGANAAVEEDVVEGPKVKPNASPSKADAKAVGKAGDEDFEAEKPSKKTVETKREQQK